MQGTRIIAAIAIAAAVAGGATVVYGAPGPDGAKAAARAESGARKDHDEHEEESVVRLTPAEMKEFGIEVGTAGGGTLHVYTTLPGEIVPNQDHLAHVVPRFPGIVTEVRKQLGDTVRKGEVLAIVESNESLVEYEMKSLIDGTVIEKHVTLGEVLGEDHVAYVIADLSTVWVNVSVYQEDLPNVRIGQKVIISAGHGTPDATAKISYIGPVVHEHTRTGLARAVLPNTSGQWRPGLFITARILVAEDTVSLLVPNTALQTIDDKTCVFVETSKGFEPRFIEIGRRNDTHVEVLSGLEPGQRYVTRGGFTIKAELSKGAFGDEH